MASNELTMEWPGMFERIQIRVELAAGRFFLAVAVAFVCLPSSSNSAPVIDVGHFWLLPNTPDQEVRLFVTGSKPVQGLDFNVQVADGYPVLGGAVDGPNISGVDVLTDTIFAASNTGQFTPAATDQLWVASTTTNVGIAATVNTEGQLATLTLDTTGFAVGSWDLLLAGTLNGDTTFAGVAAIIDNGTISIAPDAVFFIDNRDGLALRGVADIDGLKLTASDSFHATRGTTTGEFTVLSADQIVGTFATPTGAGVDSHLGNGYFLGVVTYSETDVRVDILAALVGDANGDQAVNEFDWSLWHANRFRSDTDWIRGDFNLDGVTDAADFNLWNTHWSNPLMSPVSSTVPEPRFGILNLGFLLLLARRGRVKV